MRLVSQSRLVPMRDIRLRKYEASPRAGVSLFLCFMKHIRAASLHFLSSPHLAVPSIPVALHSTLYTLRSTLYTSTVDRPIHFRDALTTI
jgi:hypothetical protein